MITYKDYLNDFGIISEDDFNEVIKSLPEVNSVNFYGDCYQDKDSLTECIVNEILNKYDCVYLDSCSFEDKELTLDDVQSLEDLESIKSLFEPYGWKIYNYDELKSDLEEEEANEKKSAEIRSKERIIESVIKNIPIEDIIKFAEKYGYKKQNFS